MMRLRVMLRRRRGVRAKQFPLRVFKYANTHPFCRGRRRSNRTVFPHVQQPIHRRWAVAVDRGGQGYSTGSGRPYCTVTFLDAAVAFFGSSSVSTPSAYLARALASSTSWDRLKVRDTLP